MSSTIFAPILGFCTALLLLSACNLASDKDSTLPVSNPPRTVPTLLDPLDETTRIFFVSGKYAFSEQALYCHTYDTLSISKIPHTIHQYRITRHIWHLRLADPLSFKPQHTVVTWTATYEPDSHYLLTVSHNPDLAVDPNKSTCTLQNQSFQKFE